MKKFVIKICILAAVVVVADVLVGVACRYFQNNSKGGDTGRMMYIADKMNADVVIFGSSRALHHYDPRVIEDSLHMSCYNCGRDGNGIIFNYGLYRLFCNRYTPKVMIYDIARGFDFEAKHDNEKYLGWLRYFYDRDGIDSIFWSVDKTERIKMLSMMRRYNEKFVQLASDWHSPQQQDIKGFRPNTGVMQYEPAPVAPSADIPEYDNLKLYYFRRLIADCKNSGTRLILMVSPSYKGTDSGFERIKAMADKAGVPFVCHNNLAQISTTRKYFYDSSHMNGKGADAYTKYIIKEVRKGIAASKL